MRESPCRRITREACGKPSYGALSVPRRSEAKRLLNIPWEELGRAAIVLTLLTPVVLGVRWGVSKKRERKKDAERRRKQADEALSEQIASLREASGTIGSRSDLAAHVMFIVNDSNMVIRFHRHFELIAFVLGAAMFVVWRSRTTLLLGVVDLVMCAALIASGMLNRARAERETEWQKSYTDRASEIWAEQVNRHRERKQSKPEATGK